MEENKTAPVKKAYKRQPRKKVCVFCQEKVTVIDYKDVNRLKKFITESGKMLPRYLRQTPEGAFQGHKARARCGFASLQGRIRSVQAFRKSASGIKQNNLKRPCFYKVFFICLCRFYTL